MNLRLDDNVLVLSGKDRGKTGKITRLSRKTGRIVVEKVNMRTKHVKKQAGQAGQKITFEAPFAASKAMVICPHCSKATRLGMLTLKNGGKQRVCKKCSQSVDKTGETKRVSKKKK